MIRQLLVRRRVRKLDAATRAVTYHSWRIARAHERKDAHSIAVHSLMMADALDTASRLIRSSVKDPADA